MRTVAIIALLALVASASAFTAYKKHTKTAKMDYASIENTPKKVTRTMGDLVSFFQTHNFQENDQLTAFLDELTAGIQADHESHLALYTAQREAAAEEFAFREGEIADGQDALARSQAQLQLAASEEDRAKNLGDLAEQANNIYKQQLVNLRESRAAQVALFNERVNKIEGAQKAIAEALNILDEFELAAQGFVPASLIQAVNSLLAVSVQTGKSHKILPIYNKLIQCQSGQFDFSDIQDLRDLISKLASNMDSALVKVQDQEAIDSQVFADSESSLVTLIEKLDNQVVASHDYAERMHGSVVQEQSISLEASGKIDRNTELLAQAHKLSDDCDAEFQQGEATRRGQLEFLSQIRSAVQALTVQFGQSLLPNIEDLVNLE